MKVSRGALCSTAIGWLTLGSLGCGTVNFTRPTTATSPTSHPLVAQYSIEPFHLGLNAWVEFGPTTAYGRQTSVMTGGDAVSDSGSGPVLNILVAGMKEQTPYHMRAHVEWPGGSWVDQDRTFTTGAIPVAQTPVPQFAVARPAGNSANISPSGGVDLLSLVNTTSPQGVVAATPLQGVVTDLQGNIIWYCPGPAVPAKPMPNGHYIFLRVWRWRRLTWHATAFATSASRKWINRLQLTGILSRLLIACTTMSLSSPTGTGSPSARFQKPWTSRDQDLKPYRGMS